MRNPLFPNAMCYAFMWVLQITVKDLIKNWENPERIKLILELDDDLIFYFKTKIFDTQMKNRHNHYTFLSCYNINDIAWEIHKGQFLADLSVNISERFWVVLSSNRSPCSEAWT